ncbi:hypothetical protein BC940DRAFT_306133 [Gongronella butleri]|nr:hypothetical protein BC940DRAFT_306133 [Gongronella butleri]
MVDVRPTPVLQAIGAFDYTAANKLASRLSKVHAPLGNVLVKLINCENLYSQLSFMKPKWFMRKDSLLNSMYTYLADDASKELKAIYPTLLSQEDRATIATVLQGIIDLCTVRQGLISVYQRLAASHTTALPLLLTDLEHFARLPVSEPLDFLGYSVDREVEIMTKLLQVSVAITDYAFQDACINVYLCRRALNDWKTQCDAQDYPEKTPMNQEIKESTSWPFGLFSSAESKATKQGDAWPPTVRWHGKYLDNLIAKMTLYFYDLLLAKEKLMVDDDAEKSLWKGLETDYFDRINTFRKRYGVHSIGLIYQVKPDKPFFPEGFVLPDTPYDPPRGIHSFPYIFCVPKQPPMDHLPSVISIIQGSHAQLSDFKAGPVHFFDKKIDSTYYLMRVDEHVTCVLIYQDKPNQKEPTTIQFLSTLVQELRGSAVVAELLRMD